MYFGAGGNTELFGKLSEINGLQIAHDSIYPKRDNTKEYLAQ